MQQINQFVIETNIQLLFGLNACYGRQSHEEPMNLSNIKDLTSESFDRCLTFSIEVTRKDMFYKLILNIKRDNKTNFLSGPV